MMEAYIRAGNESVMAPDYIVNELILKGTNQSFYTLTSGAVKTVSCTQLDVYKRQPQDPPERRNLKTAVIIVTGTDK